MTNYYYLDVTLEFASEKPNIDSITPHYYKNNIVQAVKNLFGTVGASVDIDILKFDLKHLRAVLRVPKDHYVKIRSSLTLHGDYYGIPCAYRVSKAAPLLLSLQGDSRDYVH